MTSPDQPPVPAGDVAVVVVMGVAGSGKTTVGEALAGALGWRFVEADDHQPAANIAKMARGEPLDDDDRWPWLDELRGIIEEALAGGDRLVMACSALKRSYRERLAGAEAGRRVRFAHLDGPPELFRSRLAQRHRHFMKAAMLESQLATLEVPADAVVIDAALSPPEQVEQIGAALAL